MSNNKDSFTFIDENNEKKTIAIQSSDFVLVQDKKFLSDTKMMSKPTTFFKDALKRFSKNKSSVLGAIILGILLLLAFILPSVLPYDIVSPHPYENQLAPKLFEAGTGWWDGTKAYSHIPMAIDWDKYDSTGEIDGLPGGFAEKDIVNGKNGISHGKVGDEFTDNISTYARGGYIRLNHQPTIEGQAELSSWDGVAFNFANAAKDYTISITTVDAETVKGFSYGTQAPYSFYFVWTDVMDTSVIHELPLQENISAYGTFTYKLSQDYLTQIKTLAGYDSYGDFALTLTSAQKPHFVTRLLSASGATTVDSLLIKNIIFTSADSKDAATFKSLSCYDANAALSILAKDSKGKEHDYYWTTTKGLSNLYHGDVVYCSFRLDTYERSLGSYENTEIVIDNLLSWRDKGWITGDFSKITNYEDMTLYPTDAVRNAMIADFCASLSTTDLGKIHCPLTLDSTHVLTGKSIGSGSGSSALVAISFTGTCVRWKELYPNLSSCPKHLFGTDDSGRDMLKYVFAGLRTSLLLGVITSAVCFIFGLVWGAVSGYFGGWVDIAMERFVEILSGLPWIVVMTLAIILFGSNFTTFALALCLTGWIGTASITRTQFYRFKDMEYILAARTLGASDFRLIFRHVLPNAIGTIITSSVLMIPSVIFSEATISYLNLGLQGMASFGVILSDNQHFLSTNPVLIVFPSVVMALIMISFNLFGNGLRDAFNPSLKGEE
jgi:ABC-type dipeptide/oligopeptide/nickel transport system permease subunit